MAHTRTISRDVWRPVADEIPMGIPATSRNDPLRRNWKAAPIFVKGIWITIAFAKLFYAMAAMKTSTEKISWLFQPWNVSN